MSPARSTPPLLARFGSGLRSLLMVGAVTLAAAAAMFALVYQVSQALAVERLHESALRRLDVRVAELESAWARFDFLPTLLETTPAVRALLAAPGDAQLRDDANRTLARINAIAGADMLFVLEPGGLAVAAADWDEPQTPFGHRYDYRPYVKSALAHGHGRFFGIGITSGRPGYFLSYALKQGGQVVGVATAKVNLEPAERVWSSQPGAVVVSDARDVVILSTRDDWKFRALRPLTADERAEIVADRSYVPDPPLLAWAQAIADDGAFRVATVDGVRHLVTEHAVPATGWRMQMLDSLAPLQTTALYQALLAAALTAAAWLFAVAAWQSRQAALQKLAAQAALHEANAQLERRVDERTAQLRAANVSLEAEIETRKSVESSLRATQGELVQAAKMAVLGNVSAGLAHELSQPLAALRTLSDNAVLLIEKDRLKETRGNLERISQLVARLGEIARRLKTFAHRPGDQAVPTPLGTAVANAHALVADRMKRERVAFEADIQPAGLAVLGDPTLLEQVLVNLMVNAIDAMGQAAERRLRLRAWTEGPHARIVLVDSGPGIDETMMPRLFEAFVTSKPRGAGLGLGLMISRRIVREFGGEISAGNEPGGGARFEVVLPVAATVCT